jgi:hypothetical protein
MYYCFSWCIMVGAFKKRPTAPTHTTVNGAPVTECTAIGGVSEEKDEEKERAKQLSRTDKKAQVKARVEAALKEREILRDAEIGCKALENVLDSTWWEWTNCSTLGSRTHPEKGDHPTETLALGLAACSRSRPIRLERRSPKKSGRR